MKNGTSEKPQKKLFVIWTNFGYTTSTGESQPLAY